jgi:hypothetical protein
MEFSVTFSRLQKFATDEVKTFEYSLVATTVFISVVARAFFFNLKLNFLNTIQGYEPELCHGDEKIYPLIN